MKWMNTLSKLNASDTSQHLHEVFFGESLQLYTIIAVTRHCYSYYSYCEYYHLTPNMSLWLDLQGAVFRQFIVHEYHNIVYPANLI